MFIEKKMNTLANEGKKMKKHDDDDDDDNDSINLKKRLKKQNNLELAHYEMKNINIIDRLTSTLPPVSSLFTKQIKFFNNNSFLGEESADPLVLLEQNLLPAEKYNTFLRAIELDGLPNLHLITSSSDKSRSVQILVNCYQALLKKYRHLFNEDKENDEIILGRCIEKYLFEETNFYEYVFIESEADRRINEDLFARLQAFSSFLDHTC